MGTYKFSVSTKTRYRMVPGHSPQLCGFSATVHGGYRRASAIRGTRRITLAGAEAELK
jgi:hypothetical protein